MVQERHLIVIGASTGGPPILHTIFKALPENFSIPILVAQHINSDFIDNFIEWLNSQSLLNIKKAHHNEKIEAGNIYIAPADYHILIKNNIIQLEHRNEDDHYVPSISKLFESIGSTYAKECVAIILSGMGNDGAKEIVKLKQNGALTIAQNEATSVVFGMAKEAIKMEGIEFILSPQGIVELLLELNKHTSMPSIRQRN